MKPNVFDYSTLGKKFERLSGVPYNPAGGNDIDLIPRKCACVVLDDVPPHDIDKMGEIRNWCEEHFGNNWIYSYNEFYFKREKDAILFRLRW